MGSEGSSLLLSALIAWIARARASAVIDARVARWLRIDAVPDAIVASASATRLRNGIGIQRSRQQHRDGRGCDSRELAALLEKLAPILRSGIITNGIVAAGWGLVLFHKALLWPKAVIEDRPEPCSITDDHKR